MSKWIKYSEQKPPEDKTRYDFLFEDDGMDTLRYPEAWILANAELSTAEMFDGIAYWRPAEKLPRRKRAKRT